VPEVAGLRHKRPDVPATDARLCGCLPDISPKYRSSKSAHSSAVKPSDSNRFLDARSSSGRVSIVAGSRLCSGMADSESGTSNATLSVRSGV
jgi:hypothetical protein